MAADGMLSSTSAGRAMTKKLRSLAELGALRDTLPSAAKPAVPVPALPALPMKPGDAPDLLRRAFAGVAPLDRAKRSRVAPGRPASTPRVFADDDLVRAHLRDLVSGDAPFDIADTVEYVEGSAVGLDRHVVKRLRRGDYAVQGHLDLHGLTRERARDVVVEFVREARRRAWRCVLVVHGRGHGSKDQVPVLKESMRAWLAHGWLSRQVLAFTTARPHDGGAGALYVLLRA